MKRFSAVLLLAACTATPPPRPEAASTPPPPLREENTATATGTVVDSTGRPVRYARIRAWAADASCGRLGNPMTVRSGEEGTYQVTVDRGVGPQVEGCVVVEAEAGGASRIAQSPVLFASGANAGSVQVDVALPAPPPLTRADADRLAELVRNAANDRDPELIDELSLYTSTPPDRTYSLLVPMQQQIRGIEQVRLVEERSGRYYYELTGKRAGGIGRVAVSQDRLRRIEFPTR